VNLLTVARDLRRRRAREREHLFVAEGVRAVEELLTSPLSIQGVLTSPPLETVPRGAALRRALDEAAAERGFAVRTVSEAEFRSAAETESPQGVLAIAGIPERSFEKCETDPRHRMLVLDGVQDPGNVGTMLRTAAALGVATTVALPGTVDLWNAKVVRGAMGAHFRHLAFHSTLDALLAHLEQHDIALWATTASGAPFETFAVPDRLAIAVGNEGAGVSPTLLQHASATVSLPIRHVESLNVAVATGIFLYELRV
jgi:TrmH family RNA methyltransferase